MQKAEKTIIEIGDKVLTLQIRDFGSSEIDIEDLLQIDMNAILEDIITFPVIFNRIANIKAEVDDLLRQVVFDMHVFEGQLFEKHRGLIIKEGGKVTDKSIEAAVKRDPEYKIKKYQVFRVQKQADILDGLYWSAKSKDKKLDSISTKVKPEEFEKEILDKTINSVVIRVHKNNFPSHR